MKQKVAEVMSTDLQVVGPNETLRAAARLMGLLDIGWLLVSDGRRLVGIVTDRDITVRGTATGLTPTGARVSDVMSRDVDWCRDDEDIADVLRRMGAEPVRRIAVVNAAHALVGIVELGDLATRHSSPLDAATRELSTPGQAALGG